MADLPQSFLDSMKEILGEDYEAFLTGFDGQRQYGLRVNTLKMNLEEFERIAPFHLKKVPWISNGYFYNAEDVPAKHPFYSAGLYYLQEPSAMTPASRLKVQPGERVLDLCAAPGGKATELGAALQGEGLLVANDINTARAKALLRNLELFGISNSFVTNEPPHVLAERFPEFFHKIMVDAKLLQSEREQHLYEGMANLKTEYREVLYLVSLEGMSYREAARILGKSEQQVTNLVHRGKKSLKKILEERGFIYADE